MGIAKTRTPFLTLLRVERKPKLAELAIIQQTTPNMDAFPCVPPPRSVSAGAGSSARGGGDGGEGGGAGELGV